MRTEQMRQIGEFQLIERLKQKIKAGASVMKGIGDDCAVIRHSKNKCLLFTTDMIIEGVHFTKRASPEAIGHKALAVNISDIAACGGIPRWAVVALGVPPATRLDLVEGIYRGMRRLARRFMVDIVGGDTNASEKIIISVSLIGEVEREKFVLRSGAKTGDIICLSGPLYSRPDDLTFIPQIAEARYLVEHFNIHSMIDISDGFLSDLERILIESNKSAIIYEDAVPCKDKKGIQHAILDQGEQFKLIFTIGKAESKKLPNNFYLVGEITDRHNGIISVTSTGKRNRLRPKGYSHF